MVEARRWALETALPFWARAGVDRRRGGFHEALTLTGRPAAVGYRRLRVLCRQIYAFAHGARLGFAPGLAIAADGFRYLVEHGWMGPDRGWARLLTPRGRVLDDTPDLYDHAFVLFACGWWHRASGDPDALVWAHRTLDFVEAHLRHPVVGFHHVVPARGWRLQNPHMHLLEAMLVLYETSGVDRFAELARALARLGTERFFDARTGTLGERFTDTLARAPGMDGRLLEPGHHFEWSWILGACRRLLGEPAGDEARALVAFAERHGVDPRSGATWNAVLDDGTVADGGSRTWPNTERLKAHVALFELDRVDPRPALHQGTRLLLDRYLACAPAGAWRDRFDAHGQPLSTDIPAATLYHLFLAFAEVGRIERDLAALEWEETSAVREVG